VAVKDNLVTKGILTTCASKILADYVPSYDAAVMENLKLCPVLGKTNLDEFAMGSSTETSVYGVTANPWDLELVPGGSSGGSAAAVAAGLAPFALGTDTGGSIRQPAAFCGIVGLKPTYGLVSRRGLIAFASSLDQIGPMTRTVADAAHVLKQIVGYDPFDATSLNRPREDYSAFLREDVQGLRLGLVREAFAESPEPGVTGAVLAAVRTLERLGAKVLEVSMPYSQEALAAYHSIAPAEASSNLARLDGIRFGQPGTDIAESRPYGPEVRRRLIAGALALDEKYRHQLYDQALKARRVIAEFMTGLFNQVDMLVTPAAPTPAFRAGERQNPQAMHLNDLYAIPASLAGMPALALPCGMVGGLPVGMQLVGPLFKDGLLLQVGHTWQLNSDWHNLRPGESL
jgi:aspartyl-tRNA(Asn)/glutamyl-tRNA(Gln) amidotransferase subunit A